MRRIGPASKLCKLNRSKLQLEFLPVFACVLSVLYADALRMTPQHLIKRCGADMTSRRPLWRQRSFIAHVLAMTFIVASRGRDARAGVLDTTGNRWNLLSPSQVQTRAGSNIIVPICNSVFSSFITRIQAFRVDVARVASRCTDVTRR